MAYMFVVVIPVKGQIPQNQTSQSHAAENFRIPVIVTPDTEDLEDTLSEVLRILKVDSDSWQKSQDQTTWQVTFLVDKEESDRVLQHLFTLGIGNTSHTSVSLFWSNFHRGAVTRENVMGETQTELSVSVLEGKEAERSEFIKSVKARLTVAQVVEAVKLKSVITFDYVLFVLISSVISVVGFVESSPVFTIVSILVSPLMGPILAALFGTVIRVWRLVRLGVKNEAFSMLLCVCTGLVMGVIISAINNDVVRWGKDQSWPTPQMKDRGLPSGIWIGILVSIPSGAGVALALLGGSISPLVGVAVSASLLGPLVNAGLLFGCSIVSAISPPTLQNVISPANTTTMVFVEGADCLPLQNNTYTFYYTCNLATECLCLGCVSLVHTLLDVFFIFVTGFIVLKIKEVAPHTTKSDTFDMFWKKDIKIARKSFRTMGRGIVETEDVKRQVEREEKEKRISVLPDVLVDIESDPDYSVIAHSLMDRPTNMTSSLRLRSCSAAIRRTGSMLDKYSVPNRSHSHYSEDVILEEINKQA